MKVKTDFSWVEKIISYDPGGKTGYCKLTIDKPNAHVLITEIGEFTTWDLLREQIVWSCNNKNTVVVYEDFRIRTMDVNIIPVKVQGVIEYLCCQGLIHHFPQMPGERYVIDKWYPNLVKDFPSHYGSATRHGLLFAVSKVIGTGKLPKVSYDIVELRKGLTK